MLIVLTLAARVTAYLEAAADDPGPVEERVRAIAGVTAVDRLVRDLPGATSISSETADQARERRRKRCGDRKTA